jgi:hypothetical protein
VPGAKCARNLSSFSNAILDVILDSILGVILDTIGLLEEFFCFVAPPLLFPSGIVTKDFSVTEEFLVGRKCVSALGCFNPDGIEGDFHLLSFTFLLRFISF